MELKEVEAQCECSSTVQGDSLIQLKDGKILFYYFRERYHLDLYNEKTFKKILEIDLCDLIKKYEKEKEELKKTEKKTEEKDIINEDEFEEEFLCLGRHFINYDLYNEYKNCIKELDTGSVLVGRNNYLIEFIFHEKTYDYKVIKEIYNNIVDLNELSDKRIMIITYGNIIILNRENGKCIVNKKYPIKHNWGIVSQESRDKYFGDFKQYFSTYVLPNDRLLLNSFSTEYDYHGGCGTHPPQEFSYSKIIFIDLKNFEEIKSTETFGIDAKHIVLDKIIVIQAGTTVVIYDINTLEIIKNTKLQKDYGYMYKFYNKYLITISKYEENNDLTIYKYQENDLVKHCKIKTNIAFRKTIGWNGYTITGYNNKFLFTLKNKKVIVLSHNKIYVFQLNID